MDDTGIVKGLRRGDETALCGMIDCYSSYVTAIVGNLSRGFFSAQDVEEIAADVFVGVWRNAENLRDGASLRPYLAQAARNMTRGRLRSRRGEALPLEETIIAGCVAPEEEAILREQSEIVSSAVEALEEPDREIFIRFYYFGERLAGIAGRLGLKLPTVKTKLRRARGKIGGVLAERGYGR